jgi:hypothetical protein
MLVILFERTVCRQALAREREDQAMRKLHDSDDRGGTGSGFGKTGPDEREDRQAKHVNDKDFKKGKGTADKRGDEDEM